MITLISPIIQKRNNEVKHVHFIKNGNRETTKSTKVWNQVEKLVKMRDISYSFYETEYPGHAKEIAESILKQTTNNTIIAAVGGDGTIHEVINGSIKYPHAIVVSIPAGSGNDYARGIQQSISIKDAVQLLESNNESTAIDVGEMQYKGEKRNFINSVGIGFDASITKAVNRSKWKKRFQLFKLGKFIYFYFFLKQLFFFKTFDLKTVIDGQTKHFRKVWFLVIANQVYFGGGIKISPVSSVKDRKLQVIVVKDVSPLMFLMVFATVLWGGHTKLKWVKTYTCEEISFNTNQSIPIQADGENIGYSSLSAKILPGALNVFSVEKNG